MTRVCGCGFFHSRSWALHFRGCSSFSSSVFIQLLLLSLLFPAQLLIGWLVGYRYSQHSCCRVACWVLYQTLLAHTKNHNGEKMRRTGSNCSLIVNDSDELHPVDTVDCWNPASTWSSTSFSCNFEGLMGSSTVAIDVVKSCFSVKGGSLVNVRYISEPLNPFILQETVTYSLSKRYVWVDDVPFPTVGICGFPTVGLTSTLTFSAGKVMAPKTSGMPEAKWSKVASQFWFLPSRDPRDLVHLRNSSGFRSSPT